MSIFHPLVLGLCLATCPTFAQFADLVPPSAPRVKPLPDVNALMARLTQHQTELQSRFERYTYRVETTTRELDSKGSVTKTEREEHETIHVQGRTLRRLIAKNGQPLSSSEAEKEEARLQKQLEKIQKEIEASQGKPAKPSGKSVSLEVTDILKACSITEYQRVQHGGHEVLALSFRPNPYHKPQNEGQEYASKVSGRILVDEDAAQIVRLEAKLEAPIRLFLGLGASVGAGSRFAFEQRKVAGDLWMPASVQAHLDARVLVFKKMNADITQTYSHYQQFGMGEIKGEPMARTATSAAK